MSNNIPDPILRKEKYLAKIAENTAGGGAEPTVLMANKNITANGTVNPDSGFDGFAKVTVQVPNTYSASDEGKVVDNGALVSQTSKTVTVNDTYTTTTNNQIIVNVPNTYTVSDEGKVVDNGTLVSQTATNINSNGTVDTTLYNSAVVNVPNTYTAGDEGKVVSSGALVAQTAYPSTVTVNDTYDTTNYNSITVDVPAPTQNIATGLYTTQSEIPNIHPFTLSIIPRYETTTTDADGFIIVCGNTDGTTSGTLYPKIQLSDSLTQDHTITATAYDKNSSSNESITFTTDIANNTVSYSTNAPSGYVVYGGTVGTL